MLASYLRLMLLLEAAAYAAIAQWLHFLYGWGYGRVALLCAAAALGGRFAMVCVTTSIGHFSASPRAPEHRIGAWGTLKLVLREWRAVLATNFFQFPWERFAMRRDPAPSPGGGIPIVLVHGYFANRGYFATLVRGLEAHGAGPIFTPNLTSIFATIERYAEDLHEEIERIVAGTRQPQVILIAHSMGGLGARAYLCAHGSSRVRRLVTVASPHYGTVHARLGAGDNARQMTRGSAFLGSLCEREGEKGPACGVTSIYTTHDNLVAPQATSVLPWAKNVAIAGRGHVDILRSHELLEALLAELADCGVALKP
ncbi:MAG: lipase family alpha/beta hydrolase [Usitatibacter sp.]